MWLSDRRQFLTLLAAAPVAACGFTPAYGPAGPARSLTGRITLDEPRDKNAFDLVGQLEQRLGRPQNPRWRLGYRITVSAKGLGITATNATTRYHLSGSVAYDLTDLASGQMVTKGSVQNFTAYSASGTVVSTAASERDAYQRLMRILADQIVTDLIAGSSGWASP